MFRGMWIGTLFLQASRVVVSLALCVACGPFCQGKYLHNSRAMRFAEFEIRSLPMQVSGQSGRGSFRSDGSGTGTWSHFVVFCLPLDLQIHDMCVYIIYILYIGDGDGERDIQYIYI